MDATALGSLLVGVGAVLGAGVAYFGKRSETALTGYTSLTSDLRAERDGLKTEKAELTAQVSERDARIAELYSLRAADQAEIARLRAEIIRHGGQP